MQLARAIPFVVIAGVQACGQVSDDHGTSVDRDTDGASHIAPVDSGTRDATPDSTRRDAEGDAEFRDTATDSAAQDAGSMTATPYSGSVGARLTSYEGNLSYELFASFETGPLPSAPFLRPCYGMTVGSCCQTSVPDFVPPDANPAPTAGNVTIDLKDMPLATLLAPSYPEVDGTVWNAGNPLGVSAAGSEVEPFSGTLSTLAVPTGVSPPIGSTPLVITRGSDLRIAWTPEAMDGEGIQLQINAGTDLSSVDGVVCAVPDSAGFVVVDGSLLEPLATGSASIYLTRTLTSIVAGPNATIALTGEGSLAGPATVQ